MIGDGKTAYDHANDNKGTLAGYGCEANIRGSTKPLTARITYFQNEILKLEFTEEQSETWQTCFVLSNVSLPDHGHLGLTAATGDVSDNHDVHRVTTRLHFRVNYLRRMSFFLVCISCICALSYSAIPPFIFILPFLYFTIYLFYLSFFTLSFIFCFLSFF